MKEPESGYTFEGFLGTPYHFKHIPRATAEALTAAKESWFIVETVNWTLAEGEEGAVHLNRYFAANFADALSIATRIELASQAVAEEVVGVRPATEAEQVEGQRAFEHFYPAAAKAIRQLPTKRGGRK